MQLDHKQTPHRAWLSRVFLIMGVIFAFAFVAIASVPIIVKIQQKKALASFFNEFAHAARQQNNIHPVSSYKAISCSGNACIPNLFAALLVENDNKMKTNETVTFRGKSCADEDVPVSFKYYHVQDNNISVEVPYFDYVMKDQFEKVMKKKPEDQYLIIYVNCEDSHYLFYGF